MGSFPPLVSLGNTERPELTKIYNIKIWIETKKTNTKICLAAERERERETERILKRRDRERLLEELVELESEEASCWNKIFWNSLSLLIIEPAVVAGVVYYFWSQINQALSSGVAIANLGSNLKWAAIGFAASFTLTSLSLLYYLWKISSLKKQIAKIKQKVYRLEKS